jgi:hypothetical protein
MPLLSFGRALRGLRTIVGVDVGATAVDDIAVHLGGELRVGYRLFTNGGSPPVSSKEWPSPRSCVNSSSF